MSFWTLETKADIGICGFSNSLPNLFKEISLGMLNLLIPEEQSKILHTFTRQTAQWNVEVNSSTNDYESLILVWLEEVLYKLEVE
ncbi:MAG: archease, partial [Candidatus Thermoplasmatota archaeon]|nr:archease [Candidatus Thermoplasmatota archaeon]